MSIVSKALQDVDGFLLSLSSKGYICPSNPKYVGKSYIYGVLFGEIKLQRKGDEVADTNLLNAITSKHIPFRASVLHDICHFGNKLGPFDVPKKARCLDSDFYLTLLQYFAPGLIDGLWNFFVNVDLQSSSIRSSKMDSKVVKLDAELIQLIADKYDEREKNLQKPVRKIAVPVNVENAGLGKRKDRLDSVDIDNLHYFVYSMISEGAKQAVMECLIGGCVGIQPNPNFGQWIATTSIGTEANFVYANKKEYNGYHQEIVLACPDTLHPVVNFGVYFYNLAI